MATTIVTKSGSGAPTTDDLIAGELAVDLTNKRLYTEDSGGTVLELGTNPSGDITFGDSGKAIFGAGSDLQIYSDGTTGQVTGNVNVTGTVTADGLTVDGATLLDNGANATHLTLTGTTGRGLEISTATNSYTDNTAVLNAQHSQGILSFETVSTERLRINTNGDISFYEDTGTTPRMTWSSSNEDLSIVDGTAGGTFTDAEGVRGSTNGLNTQLQLYKAGGNDSGISLASGSSGSAAVGLYANKSGTSQADFFIRQDTGSGTSKETFRITDSGNVGIGTTAPESITHIKDTGDVRTTLQIEGAATGYAPVINFDGIVGANADYLLGEINGSWDTHTNVVSSIRFESGADTTNKDDGLISFWTSSSGPTLTERMRIDASGHAIIPAGVTLGTAAGVYAAANTLDDYEEGTWVPVLSKSTTAPTVTYTTQTGTYTKVGRMIYVSGFLSWTAISGGTGDFRITNLPFTVLNSSGAYPQLVCTDYSGVTFGANDTTFGGFGAINGTYIVLLAAKNNATNSTAISGLASSGFMYFNLTYQA